MQQGNPRQLLVSDQNLSEFQDAVQDPSSVEKNTLRVALDDMGPYSYLLSKKQNFFLSHVVLCCSVLLCCVLWFVLFCSFVFVFVFGFG